jgi:hypothetical protein
MISLIKILQEENKGPIDLPSNHEPFMYSEHGFSCAKCKYYHFTNDQHICGNQYFQSWNGSGVMDIEDPNKWCSDWFSVKE